jgi:hypothetical protein
MTSTQLNSQFADIIDEISVLIDRFAELRDEVTDEVWDRATQSTPWGDTLCDIEYTVEQLIKSASAACR